MAKRLFVIVWVVFVLTAPVLPLALAQGNAPSEVPVQVIALSGPAAEADAEISGLAWYGDTLVLMVENPNLYASEGNAGKFFALAKDDLLAYLDAEAPEPLEPVAVPILASDIPDTVPGFDGFEAITFVDDAVYLTIEAWLPDGTMRGYLVAGTVEPDLSAITLDLATRVELLPQTPVLNIAYESILAAGDQIVAFYELYGPALNETPFAYRVSADLQTREQIPMAPLDYRLTDVTALDAENQFWGINYFYPGDTFAATGDDPITETYGEGPTHATHDQVERLVAFQYAEDGITRADVPPIQLELTDEESRNWEGIVRLDERGFLLVTDKYPETILGFVPLPQE